MISQNATRAIIFDWDGLIADSDPFFEYATTRALREGGLPHGHDVYVKHFLGRRLTEGLRDYLKEVKQPLRLLKELRRAKMTFDGEYEDWIKPYEDAIDLIDRLRKRYPLAIATGTRRALLKVGLRKFCLEGAFVALVTAEDYKEGKPAPDSLFAARDKVNRECRLPLPPWLPWNFVVLEDSPTGVRAAWEAGMKCVAVTHSHTAQDLKQANLVLNDLRDFDPGKWKIK